jgi:hypothetical protein
MIVRQQFTAWNRYQLPQFNNQEYMEYKWVESGISKEVCTFGYFDTEKKTWVKLADVPKEIKEDL